MSDLPPKRSLKRWLVTTNHKDVGILYLTTSLVFLLLGGILALIFRAHLWESGGTGLLSGNEFNQSVTTHGLVMVFWFLSPIATGFANYLVPLQIGAKDLAFPRLNALSYWLYLFSGVLLFISFFQGGSWSGGWTIYAPLNVPMYTPGAVIEASVGGTMAIIALMMFVISITMGTINFLTTIHRQRAEGLGLWNMPLFTWSWLLTVWMMLFAFAALFAALIMLTIDRVMLTQYFATDQGSGLLWAHLFWFFGHPEVYIVFFPALGIMFETFQTFCGRRLVGRKWVIISMILVAVQSFLVWMHHMFLTTINLEVKTLFMATTIGISLPFDLMVFALIYTMVKGRVRFTTPFLFSLGALVLFILGGITGVFLGAVVLDYEFRGTYWVVAHFHYVMVSGVTALVGGLYYWWPKISGRMYHEFTGKLHFAAYFIGFNLLYFPMFLTWETPRRVFHYSGGDLIWHQMATIGAFVFGFSFLIMFANFAWSLIWGPKAPDNPWKYSRTAEWAIPSPPPLDNWPGRPSYASGTLEFVEETSAHPAGAATDGGTAATDGGTATVDATVSESTGASGDEHAHEGEHADHASIWPFMIGLGTFIMFLGMSGMTGVVVELMSDQIAAHLGTEDVSSNVNADQILGFADMNYVYLTFFLGGIGFLSYSLFMFGKEQFNAPEMEVAERWPFEGVGNTKFGVWVFLASDVIVFGAVIGAYLFMRIWAGWFTFEPIPDYTWAGLLNTYILLTSSFTVILALVMAERSNKKGLMACLGATIMLGLAFMAVKAWEWGGKFAQGDYWFSGLEYSLYYVTTGLHALHVIFGLLVGGFMLYRIYTIDAYLEDERPVEFFGLYWHFVDIVWVILFPLFYLM
ncbi:cbb3-type cytochrome c oxidase subunit I [Halovivax gelatinilyticus]|uniref:cbb3-type cytochrome c oxidase subunit I n=1 Tax=Halovivax gelatinilyticus TaxID=2961597 RepID=UPI0020CA4209|nr:cbb3-type cytochrome c oxidase subunit I [Halovivax gelatinilyticus]